MNKRKAQAATEFLMTYAWAFLIIIAGLGTFIYIQTSAKEVVNPSCSLTNGIECYNFQVAEDYIELELRNNEGRGINITRMTCNVKNDMQDAVNTPLILQPGNISDPIRCPHFAGEAKNELVKADIIVYYIPDGFEFERTTEGIVVGLVS